MNHKKILTRITGFKSHLNELTKSIRSYIAKNSELRDKNDELAKCIIKYKKVENFETTSQYAMSIAAEIVSKVGDHQTAAIKRIETKVLPNLSTYGRICKCLKGDVENAMKAEQRVIGKKKIANAFSEKAEKEPEYRGIISDAEKELENAIAESSRLNDLSQEQVLRFEHKRLTDLKESLKCLFRIEISKHAKSLELFTDAYKYINSIDEDSDLEVLQKNLKLNKLYLNSKRRNIVPKISRNRQ